MKLLISLSAKVEYAKGDRVAFKAAKDEWYVGTVTSVRNGNVGILFDDGVKGTPAKPNARTWKKLGTSRKFKKPLTDAQVAELPVAGEKVEKVKAPAKVTRSKSPAPTSNKSAGKETEPVKLTAEERALVQTMGLSREFDAMQTKRRGEYLELAWHRANKLFFGNRLKPCPIYLMKDMGDTFRRRGLWSPGRRRIGISPRLFLGAEVHVLTTLVHEMCHQAVTEIDLVLHDGGKHGHGPHWEAWMRKCGLTPNRYSQYDNSNFLTEEEKIKHETRKTNQEAAKEMASKTGMKKAFPSKMTPMQFHDPNKNEWVKGLVVGPNDQLGKRWMVITHEYSNTWQIIPSDWFYELPKEQHAKYLTEGFVRAAQNILDYKDRKASQRRDRAEIRKLARLGIYG